MTCIAGYLHGDGHATLIADTLASTDRLAIECVPHKLFVSGAALVGVSGDMRVGQLIRYRSPGVELGSDGAVPSLLRWLEAIRALLREAGAGRSKEGVDELTDSRMLVALGGWLLEVDGAWQIVQPQSPFWAIGSGQLYALAALDTLDRVSRDAYSPADKLRAAMLTVAKFDPGVRAPFELLTDSLGQPYASAWARP